jgi:uncharacterized SAM-binding protein YcdF (DUF218 family)
MLFGPIRLVLKIFGLFIAAVIVYFAFTFLQVWLTSLQYAPRNASAIVVMGAAQYNGVPSPDLAARLNEAAVLFEQRYSKLIVVTGNKEKGDRYTEAQAGDRYLQTKGIPAKDILEAGGDDSYQNLVDADKLLKARRDHTILISTDPFHEDRSLAIASGLGLSPYPTPTHSSPIKGWSTVPYFFKETIAVGLGRIIGYGHLNALHADFDTVSAPR